MHVMRRSDLRDVSNAHIVFCSMAAGRAQLDCVSESEGTRGWPFSLVLDVPEGAEWATMAARLLGLWMYDARAIAIRLEPNRRTARVRMSDGENAVRLDLVEVRLEPVV